MQVPPSSSQGTSRKLEEMLRKQTSHFKAFSRTVNGIKIDELTSRWEFEDKIKSVEARWSAIDSLHWEIDSEFYENHEYEQTFSKYEQQFQNIKRSLNTKLWAQCHREKITPQMDIPTFSGSYQQWVSFKDLFEESVHNNATLSNAQKMQFLKSKLRGDAEKLVQHLPISSENYEVSWNILSNRYSNKKLIFNSYMSTLTSLPQLQQQTAAAIQRVYDTTNECINAIKVLGIDTKTWDPLVVFLISGKLDANTHTEYVQSLKNPKDLPTLKELLDFLELKFTALEVSKRKPEVTKPKQQGTSTNKTTHFFKSFTSNENCSEEKSENDNSNISTSKKSNKCAVCNDEHKVYQCDKFQEMEPHMRQTIAEQLSLCNICLYPHGNKKCFFAKNKCTECEGEHNTLLHITSTTAQVQHSSLPCQAGNFQQIRQKGNARVLQGGAAEILLATAMINVVKADGSKQTLRALIDQGSQTSLISENAAQLLGIKRQRCKGVIFGVGANEMNSKGKISISMSSLYNDFEFETDVFVMKNLVNDLPNQTFAKPLWPHLENIQLADPEFYKSRTVDLLLGANVYSSFILGGIIKEDKTTPIAQQTQLGWILCGRVRLNRPYHCNVVLADDSDLSRFWVVENIVDQTNISTKDIEGQQLHKATAERQKVSQYVVRLPLHSNVDEKQGHSGDDTTQTPESQDTFGYWHQELKIWKAENEMNAIPIRKSNSEMSFPKIKLSGTHLSNLTVKVTQSLNGHKIELHGCCDSTAVLGWLELSRWKPLVANKVKTKTGVMPSEYWRSIKSSENPSPTDCASHELTMDQLYEHSLWWDGPRWLPSSIEENEKIKFETHLEARKLSVNIIQKRDINTSTVEQLICKPSSFERVSRALAWIMRAITRDRDCSKQLYETDNEILSTAKLKSTKSKSGVRKRPVVKVSILPVYSEIDKTTGREEKVGKSSSEPKQTTRKRQKRVSPVMSCINFMTMITCLMICATTIVNGSYNITSMQSNNSIYFDKVSNMQIIQDKWKIIVYYDMDPYWKGTTLLTSYYKHLDGLCSKLNKIGSHCDVILLQLRHGFSELEYYNRMLKHSDKLSRTKRGLIDGVGNIANSLFGVLDNRFAEQYEKDISMVRSNQKHLVQLWKNQTSVIEAENNLLKRVESSMEKQYDVFNQHLNALEQAENKLNDAIMNIETVEEFMMSSIIANRMLVNLKNIQDTLLETITNYHEFNVHLLTPAQLREQLSTISGQLSKDLLLPINNIQTDLAKIYKILRVRARLTSRYFIFEIQIPLVNRDGYEIFKTISVPQQVGNTIVSITPIEKYLGINIQKDTYLPISENELQFRCTKLEDTLHLCELQKPAYQKASGDNLCVKDHQKGVCRTIISACQPTWTELINVNTFMLTCCGQCTIRFICEYQVTQKQLTGVSIIALGSGCVIKGESFTITSHKQHTNALDIEPDVLKIEIAPVNNIINLTMPISPMNESNHSFLGTIENINKRISAMKTAAESIEREGDMSSHDVHHYVAIYAIAAAVVVCGAYAWWRARRTTASFGNSAVLATRMTVCEPPAPPAAPAHVQLIPSTGAATVSSGVSVSELGKGSNIRCEGESVTKLSANRQSVKYDNKDRATSPILSRVSFAQ